MSRSSTPAPGPAPKGRKSIPVEITLDRILSFLPKTNDPPQLSSSDEEMLLTEQKKRRELYDQVQAEMSEMRDRLRSLAAKSDGHREKLSALNRVLDPLRRFPDEVLQKIFLQCRDIQDSTHCLLTTSDPWRVAQVSRKWRFAALSYPALWSQLHLDLNYTQKPGSVTLLGTYLSRSLTVPLRVKLQSTRDWGNSFPMFMSHLASSAPRWRSFELIIISSNSPRLSWMKDQFMNLESLTSKYMGNINYNSGYVPLLSQIVTSSPLGPRTLHLYLDTAWVQKGGREHKLLTLTLKDAAFPALQTLKIESAGNESLESFSAFLTRSNCSLTKLEILIPSFALLQADNLLAAGPRLRTLRHLYIESNSVTFIHQLIQEITPTGGSSVGSLFPDLQTLSIFYPTDVNVDSLIIGRLRSECPDITLCVEPRELTIP